MFEILQSNTGLDARLGAQTYCSDTSALSSAKPAYIQCFSGGGIIWMIPVNP